MWFNKHYVRMGTRAEKGLGFLAWSSTSYGGTLPHRYLVPPNPSKESGEMKGVDDFVSTIHFGVCGIVLPALSATKHHEFL